MLCTVGSVTIK